MARYAAEKLYQRALVKKVERLFLGCFIVKNDPAENQGIPDLLILFGNRWAMLEVKLDDDSDLQPNQDYYINMFGKMSFASFINPDTEEVVLRDLQSAFRVSR